jgi:ribosome-associated heat shock protein Hsp15
MRIDKFLWCVRLQKTRSKSSKFIEGGNVKIVNEVIKKSSREIKIDQTFSLREQPIWRKYKVLDIPKSRVGAKLVADLIIEITSEADLKLLAELQKQNQENRLKGMLGRPTKRNRRDLDEFFED